MGQKINVIKTLLKQWICVHKNISTNTEVNFNSPIFLIKSVIICDNCKKTFPFHQNALCCHVLHIHADLMLEKLYQYYKSVAQSQDCALQDKFIKENI